MFTTVERWVGVETREIYPGDDGGRLLQSDRQSAKYHGVLDVDREAFVDLLAERLAFYG
jgi:pyrimidine-specific ribonucleoside hydrolase